LFEDTRHLSLCHLFSDLLVDLNDHSSSVHVFETMAWLLGMQAKAVTAFQSL
jgi:hypothetical protein